MHSDWCNVRLGDYVDACLGKMLDGRKNKGELQPYLGNVNVRWGAFDLNDLSEMRFEPHEEERYGLLPGDLVVCEGGEPGRCAIWTGQMPRMKIQKALHRVRPKPSLDNYYLFYWFRYAAKAGLLEPHFTGTTIKHLTGRGLAELRMPLPPIAVQRSMVKVLRRLDERIDLLRRTSATLESIAEALFKSWFIDFDPVRAKSEGREPEGMDAATAALFPAEFEGSALGLIPKGWCVGMVEDLLVLQRGFDLPASQRTEGAFPVLAASGPSGTHFESMVKGPGVTTGRSGVIGKVFFVHDDFWPLNTSLWVKEFKLATPEYAYQFLKTQDLKRLNAGSAVPTLNRNHVHAQPAILPPAKLVAVYSEVASSLLTRCGSNEKHAESLAVVRDTTLPRLISGRLRLAVNERLQEAVAGSTHA